MDIPTLVDVVLHNDPVTNIILVGTRPAPFHVNLLLVAFLNQLFMINESFYRIWEIGARSPPKEPLSRSSRFILGVVVHGECNLVQPNGPLKPTIQLAMIGRGVHIKPSHGPYFTNDPIFRSCALKRASTRILGFADILKFVCQRCFP